MKKILCFAALLFTFKVAQAAPLPSAQANDPLFTEVSLSSGVSCIVMVSTYLPTQLDNFNGGCGGLMANRTELLLGNPTGGTLVQYGYNNQVTTGTSGGFELPGGASRNIGAGPKLHIWAMSQAASAPQPVRVGQATPQF